MKQITRLSAILILSLLVASIAMAAEESAPKQDEDAQIYKACYGHCVDKIDSGVIARAEGMACMALCLSDNINGGGRGALRGRLYLKFVDGRIEKGLRIPVRLVSLGYKPEKAPDNFDEQKKKVVDFLNTMLQERKTVSCGKPDEYPTCGYGMENMLGLMTVWQGFTDIDTGAFTISGLPDGDYALWIDWYRASPTDPNSGTVYRWIMPFKVGEQKSLNADLNDGNISFIMNNFNRAFFGE